MELFSFTPHNPTGKSMRSITYFYPDIPANDPDFFFIGVFGSDPNIDNMILYPNIPNHKWEKTAMTDFSDFSKIDLEEIEVKETNDIALQYRFHRASINGQELQFMILNTEMYETLEMQFVKDMGDLGFTFVNEDVEYIYQFLLKSLNK